jgi:hypothetical protein
MLGVGSAAEAENLVKPLDIPLPEINMSDNRTDIEVIVSYIQHNFNDMLTDAELGCLVNYYGEQLDTESSFNLKLYADYLNDSNSHPIKGVELNAKELYAQAPGVHDFIDKMNGLTAKYSTLSHDQKVDFLMNKIASDNTAADILDNASVDEYIP